jgi:ATP-dependent Clp protease ATP-binding subunit ClpA
MVEPSEALQLVFDKAMKDAKKLKHEYVTIEHLLYAMLCEQELAKALKGFGADLDYIKTNLEHHLKTNCDELKMEVTKFKPKKTQTVERVLNRAFTQTLFSGRANIELTDVILSILSEKKSVGCYWLEKGNINKENLPNILITKLMDSKMKIQDRLTVLYMHLLQTLIVKSKLIGLIQ